MGGSAHRASVLALSATEQRNRASISERQSRQTGVEWQADQQLYAIACMCDKAALWGKREEGHFNQSHGGKQKMLNLCEVPPGY